ncbi:hypothetical protein LTR84_012443 [Exophiala bonariae]|uniref:non-specific serine/threonine protein kinase n=1 Tax=Exophiala bonariae TaxID=1690606 RepID=A0AAV9MRI9_9EURO|nr:hypothetical protein LTR84_012443 [Exophiala bonariae]
MEKIYDLYGTSNLLLFNEESILDYEPGGYHPVVLGDTLKNGRYKIYHKLGHGGFSTVWVARDAVREQWVAIKIVKAKWSDQFRELLALRALSEHAKGNLGSKYIVQLVDDFRTEGPNGSHLCLVLELLGPTINITVDDYHQVGERLDAESIVKISTQLLEALTFLHEKGFAHGDLSVRNLAFNSGRLSRLSEKELFEILGPSESEDVTRIDGRALEESVPRQLVKSTEWTGWPDEDDDEDENIRLIDLGEAFTRENMPAKLAQPEGLQAPETIFTDKFDSRLDLWRAGLIIYYLTFGVLPFQWFRIDSLVASMIDLVGELPKEWQPKWRQLRVVFNENVDDQELQGLLPVIKGLMVFSPADRISASDAFALIKSSYGESCAESLNLRLTNPYRRNHMLAYIVERVAAKKDATSNNHREENTSIVVEEMWRYHGLLIVTKEDSSPDFDPSRYRKDSYPAFY